MFISHCGWGEWSNISRRASACRWGTHHPLGFQDHGTQRSCRLSINWPEKEHGAPQDETKGAYRRTRSSTCDASFSAAVRTRAAEDHASTEHEKVAVLKVANPGTLQAEH